MPDRSPRRRSISDQPALLPLWAALIVAALGGFVLDLAFPAVGWWPLAFVGVAMALVPMIGRSAWGAWAVGTVFLASFYLIHIAWITRYLGLVPWFALAGIETLLGGVTGIALTLAYRWMPRIAPGRWGRLLALPALIAGIWTARELFLGSWPYTGFPWARIGMSQSESPLAHVASWTGVTGLTFLMVFFVAAVIEWVRAGAWRSLRAGGRRSATTVLPALVVAVVLLVTPQFPTTAAGTWTVGSVQGNGPAGYFDEREPYAILQSQLDATEPIVGEPMDVLLWPEGGIDADPTHNESVARVLDRLAKAVDAPLVVNAATQRGEDTFNTSMLWEAGAENPLAIHDKSHPVPMGEYVPDRWFYEMLAPDLIGLIQREYTPGTNPPFFDVNGVGVGLAICFDVIYDDVIWSGARDGAEIYLLQTNNADFRDTDENLQQLAFARMRAIETGRTVVNLSTVGTSQVIAPDGTEIDSLPEAQPGAMLTEVPLRTGLTGAVVVGPAVQLVLGWGSVVAFLGIGLLARRARRRAESGDESVAPGTTKTSASE
ncbi:apolipoprotein N-acyltransferase [Microbacterium sp. bgisy203]|uniref:apolipoprotein N-acyltransferase n=1 Tax=Microbacterium sp. bgisy203 TaxID=3413799 RepID=UPI003D762DA3